MRLHGVEDGVTLKKNEEAKKLLCYAPKNSLLFFHNHPKNTQFSERDLESFMLSDAIKMMSVVGNNGKVFFLLKSDGFNKFAALYKYDKIYKTTENSCVREFLRTCSSVGLKFIWR